MAKTTKLSFRNFNWKSLVKIIVAIVAGVALGAGVDVAVRPTQDGDIVVETKQAIELSEEQVPALIETESGTIETVEAPTVEAVDGNQLVDECPEGEEECGQGRYVYAPTDTALNFKNYTYGGCWDVDGAYGAQSLIAGTQILMYNGEYKNVEELQEGDLIMAADGKTINHVANNDSTEEEIYEVETNNGYIRGTAGHRVFVNGEAIELQNLQPGMVIDTPEYEGVDLGLTDDEYRFLGMWLGDGTIHIVRNKYPEIIVTVGTQEKVDYMRKLNLDMTERTHSNGSATVFYLKTSETKLYEVISKYSNKNIPVLSEGSELVLEGVIRADGTQRKDDGVAREGQYVISNTNKTMLTAIQEMAWRSGYTAKMSKAVVRESTNLSDSPKPIYRLSINKNPKRQHTRGEVLKVTATGEKEYVYHLNVWEENHSYIADGLAHHNCWDLGALFWMNYTSNGRSLSTCGTGAAYGAWNCKEQNAGDDFELIYDATQLQAGDWVIFGGGQYGHVGMALGGYNNGYVALYGQNQGGKACEGGGSSANVINISTKNFLGAFRPKSYIKVEPTPEPEEATIPVTGCVEWGVQKGDTMSKIMLDCEGTVVYGEAMNAYADSWVSRIVKPGQTVLEGWKSASGVGLYAGDWIDHNTEGK